MLSKLSVLLAAVGLVFPVGTIAAEQSIQIKKDPAGKYFVVERQGTPENPVLITKRVGQDASTHFIKRAFDCKSWKVRNLGSGPTLEAMNKGTPEPETSAIEPGSIPDHFARHACPPPHPAHKP